MGFIGFLMSIVGFVFMLVGLVPLLGWLNWFVAPFAFIGLIVSLIGVAVGGGRLLGIIGAALCFVVMIVSIIRLILGFGVI